MRITRSQAAAYARWCKAQKKFCNTIVLNVLIGIAKIAAWSINTGIKLSYRVISGTIKAITVGPLFGVSSIPAKLQDEMGRVSYFQKMNFKDRVRTAISIGLWWLQIRVSLIAIGFIIHIGIQAYRDMAIFNPVISASTAVAVEVEPSPTATPSATPQVSPKVIIIGVYDYKAVDDEIRAVFGAHYDDAMLLLRGNGTVNGCRENSNLNPKSVNKNTDNVGSIDYGVFQINDYWQGFRHDGKAKQFLLDYRINIRVAWNIYQADNYSFKQWTCGREYGI